MSITPTTSRTPRRGIAAIGLLALAGLLLSACGDDSDGGDSAPDQSELQSALITTDDVPEGFEEAEDAGDESEDEESDEFDGTCFEDVDDFDSRAGDPAVEAKTKFDATDSTTYALGAEIEAGVAYYDDEDKTAEEFDSFVDDLAACTEIQTTNEEGATFDLTLTTDDGFEAEGADDAVKLVLAGTVSSGDQSLELQFSVVAIRKGAYVSNVSTAAFQTSELSNTVDELARTQFENVVELAG